MKLTIAPGDRVSWRLDAARLFGVVVAHPNWANTETRKNAFHVRGDDGLARVIATRFITKEVDQCTTH